MGKLTDTDRKAVEDALRAGVLEPVDWPKMDLKDGAVVVLCGDGDQSESILDGLTPEVEKQCGTARIQLVALNGGGPCLSPTSPLSNLGEVLFNFLREAATTRKMRIIVETCSIPIHLAGYFMRVDMPLLFNIWGSVKLKRMRTVVLISHAPCGMAGMCMMSFVDLAVNLIKAKTFIKRVVKVFDRERLGLEAKVVFPCLVHVDYGDGRKELYHFKTGPGAEWLAQRTHQ